MMGPEKAKRKFFKVVEGVGEDGGNLKTTRRIRGGAPPQYPDVEAYLAAAGAARLLSQAKAERFEEIAREKAAHFAHFSGDDKPAIPAADATASTCVDEQNSRASQLLARFLAAPDRLDHGKQGVRSSPFCIAKRLIEDRVACQESLRVGGGKPKSWLEWSPAAQPYFVKKRAPPSLHDMAIEVLCDNIGHVESLIGVPDATKKKIASRLCAKSIMTSAAGRLYFESGAEEIVIPDCKSFTEKNLMTSVACCVTQQLEGLELGMCGRGLSDKLCSMSLAGFASLPRLKTLVLTGAYLLTDTGLKSLLDGAPNLITLNLSHCNKIAAAGVQAVANSIGPKLKALSLESCSQLDALQILPSLVKMSGLKSLNLSGITGMSDGVMTELAVVLGPNLRDLSIADCTALTDVAIKSISLCCTDLRLLDISETPFLTDEAIENLANGCRSLTTFRLKRGKFSDIALAALVTASGSCLCEFSLSNVRQVGDNTLTALSEHSKSTLEKLDISFCRTVSDRALRLLADSCSGLREIRIFGCNQITKCFLNENYSELEVIH